ncbi:MAG TPA: BTAD domain-containing putative transcriptional regulator [Amycolatopsis sp.]|nr:BTAD domain-containing putative transcriptional regulator [Amycolatopsis sp.]
MRDIRIGLLGPLEVRVDGELVVVPGNRPAAMLALLALSHGRPVSVDTLVERVWGGRLGDSRNAVAVAVTRLRKVLGADAVVAEAGGYRLAAPPGSVDADRFAELIETTDGSAATRLARVEEALALWRGEPLTALDVELPAVVGALHELRSRAWELAAELRLELGRHEQVAAELPALVAAHPLRERFTVLLMTAWYRCGRQAEALRAFDRLRRTLADELGVDPGPATRRLHQQILDADPALDAGFAHPSPAQLPPSPPGLVGREAELLALHEAAERPSSIGIVTGPAGVGKTALALAWAHAVRDEFPDGQLYLDLNGFGPAEPMSTHDAVTALLRSLRVPEPDPGAALETRSALLRTALAGRRLLLLLDNARDSAQVLPLLPGDGCVTVVTSRGRLPGLTTRHATRLLALAPLAVPDALRLLARAAGQDRVAAEPDAARDVIELGDRLPLAIAVAAERIARSPGVPISEFAAELAGQDRLDALDAGSDLTASMRAVLGWSYAASTPEARTFLRRLGALPTTEFDLAAAAAAAGYGLGPARRAAEELSGLHLARRVAGNRLALHDLVRAYAAEQLTTERADARARLIEWYRYTIAAACAVLDPRARPVPLPPPGVDAAPLAFAGRAEALSWCDTERRTVFAIAEDAARAGLHESVDSLAELYWVYLDMRGRPHEVRAICELAAASARAAGDEAAEARHLNRLGIAHLLLGEFDAAEKCGQAALVLDRARADHAAEAETLTNLARIAITSGRAAEAIPLCEAALSLLPAPERGWRAWNNLATALQRADRLPEAAEAIDRALHAATLHSNTADHQQALDAAGMAAYSRDTRGHIHLQSHRPADALADFRHAHHIAVELGEWRLEAEALIGAGHALHTQGRRQAAHRTWAKALEVFEDAEAHIPAGELREVMAGCCT